jgi:hypothetical protein
MPGPGPKAVNQSSTVLCRNKDCERPLYGPVAFCPYCGVSKPTVEDKPPPWRGREGPVEAVTVIHPRVATRTPEPVASEVKQPQPQVGMVANPSETATPSAKVAESTTAAPGTPATSREIRPPLTPAVTRFNKWYIVLGLFVASGVYYYLPIRGRGPTPRPAVPPVTVPQSGPSPTAPSSGGPKPRPAPAPTDSNLTVQDQTPLSPLPPVHAPPAVADLTNEEICAALSTGADRVNFTGRLSDRHDDGRFAVFHVQHGSRVIPCLVDRIATEELPKAEAAARGAADQSELKLNLSHTIQELQKGQRTLTTPPSTTGEPAGTE